MYVRLCLLLILYELYSSSNYLAPNPTIRKCASHIRNNASPAEQFLIIGQIILLKNKNSSLSSIKNDLIESCLNT